MHAASQSTGLEQPSEVGKAGLPGHEWSAEDQEAYDKEMSRAVGSTGASPPSTMNLPADFIPLDDERQQEKYAESLVSVLKNLKAGYWDELLSWAESGSTVSLNRRIAFFLKCFFSFVSPCLPVLSSWSQA